MSKFCKFQVNSLNFEVMSEMAGHLNDMASNPSVQAGVLISGKPNCFIAGADISMIENCKTYEEAAKVSAEGQIILNKVERSTKPIVAAIQGTCLGGGLEVALACHYRIAVKDSKTGLGLPEVMLGLLPGGGGTVRLPRLISVPNALDMELTGKTVRADKAKKFGLVDMLVVPLGPGNASPTEITQKYLEEVAIMIAKQIATGQLKVDRSKKGLMDKAMNFAFQYNWVKDKIFEKAKGQVMKMSGGLYPAPLRVSFHF